MTERKSMSAVGADDWAKTVIILLIMPQTALYTSDQQRLRARRAALAERMGAGIAILPTRGEAIRNADTHYPYRFDSSFHYLTGFPEPDAVLVLLAGKEPRSILFCRPKNVAREIWEGFHWGPEAAVAAFGVDEAWSIEELDQRLPELLADQSVLFSTLGSDDVWDARLAGWVNKVREQARRGVDAPETWTDVRTLIHEQRLFKDEHELQLMRTAATISAGAHRRAMLSTRPGQYEYQVEAELLHEFTRHGSRAPAYPSIVAAGANACVLHYVDNQSQMADGELLLIDAGCEWQGYAADITRTFPVGTCFTGAQRDCYELVLAAQAAAIAAVVPGAHWNAPHLAAVNTLAQGMLDLGLLQGSLEQVVETSAYSRFYMHRTGHWLGLDVHDVGRYKIDGEWRPLQAGMVLTVEPGLYIRPADDVPVAFHNIGIRIEDDVLVTADGHEVLTIAAPKAVAELEALRREAATRL